MANKPSAGSQFMVSISGVPTLISCTGVSAFGADKAQIENTPLEASSKTFLDDVPDQGEITTQVYLDHSAAVTSYLHTAANTTGQVDSFTVKPSGTAKTYVFSGLVMSFKPSFQKGAAQMAELKVKLTGNVTYA